MRSEKEIKKEIRIHSQLYEEKLWSEPPSEVWDKALKFVLEGEPRYSLAELDRLYLYLGGEHPDKLTSHGEFRALLKDNKKVQEILK